MRPQIPVTGGIALVVLGAILRFALAAGRIFTLDVHVVGVILMFAGLAAVLIPLLLRGRAQPARLQPPVQPQQPQPTSAFRHGDVGGPQSPENAATLARNAQPGPRPPEYETAQRADEARARQNRI